ncbi:MAG: hypothetical protein BRC30_03100 [Nanohaloarchaea archaeon SW_7_46_7]|nr:MAG: hypothetical protein BRC30_03100 [Nanohaloarchaea archaeon SW_7_46_7]
MLEPDPQLIFLVVFLAGLTVFLYKDRNKIQRSSILFYRRTKSGIDKIDAIQKRLPRFWKAYGWGAAVSGVISIAVASYYIGTQYMGVFQSGSIEESGLSAVLPGLVAESSFQPGVSFIPVEYWIISIGVLMTVHELSHGIVARSEGFEINSVGWIVLGIFPGAFVEPKGEKMLPNDDEKHMQKDENDEEEESTGMWDQGSLSSRIKVLGAGSFANYLTAIVFILLSTAILGVVAEPGDVVYVAEEDYPAAQAGLNNGTVYSINGESIESQSQLKQIASNIRPGDQVTLNTSEGVRTVNATEKDGDGYIGIRFGQGTQLTDQYQPYSGILNWFLSLFETVAILNIGIGLVNMLPFKPLDGGQIIGGLVEKYSGENGVKAFNYFSILGMLLLIGTILLSVATAI